MATTSRSQAEWAAQLTMLVVGDNKRRDSKSVGVDRTRKEEDDLDKF